MIYISIPVSASPLSERARSALEETLLSTRHIIQETVFIHVQATDGMSSITQPEGVKPCYYVCTYSFLSLSCSLNIDPPGESSRDIISSS